jgi:hypothetical protein
MAITPHTDTGVRTRHRVPDLRRPTRSTHDQVERRPALPNAASEDIRKVHAEVLQIVNQRFTLTSAAVVFFGGVAGWVSTVVLRPDASAASGSLGMLPFVAMVLVSLVLYLLFEYQVSLAITLRWLTTYLMVCGSEWEWLWYQFRRDLRKPPSGSKMKQLSIEAPFLAYSRSTGVLIRLVVVSFGYFLALYLLTQWQAVLAAPPAINVARGLGWLALGAGTFATRRHMLNVVARCDTVSESEMHDVWYETYERAPKSAVAAPTPTSAGTERGVALETPGGMTRPYPRGD